MYRNLFRARPKGYLEVLPEGFRRQPPIYSAYEPQPRVHLAGMQCTSNSANGRYPHQSQINTMFLQRHLHSTEFPFIKERLICGNFVMKLAKGGGRTYCAIVVLAPSFNSPIYSSCNKYLVFQLLIIIQNLFTMLQ